MPDHLIEVRISATELPAYRRLVQLAEDLRTLDLPETRELVTDLEHDLAQLYPDNDP